MLPGSNIKSLLLILATNIKSEPIFLIDYCTTLERLYRSLISTALWSSISLYLVSMMTLANYGIGSSKHNKDPNSAKVLSKSLQIRNRAELLLKQCFKSHFKLSHEKRNEILNSVKDYYSRIPFNVIIWNKYQTKQCIIDSILLLDSKFNPYKAREAFMQLESMLINLVHLPWHHEFRTIFTYSGQFRLAISDPLIGVEEMLKAAGYQQSRDQSMQLTLPEDKMPQIDDGESVTSVIFDCIVAQIVCSDIIEVFENCCKAARQSEDYMCDVNCYSWIQAYFRERSHQTTERACSSIQELLNNITNHLSKTEATKSTIGHQPTTISQSNGMRESPRPTAQERTREFLAQQSREDNLLTISNDLLRLPVSTTTLLDNSSGRKVNRQDGQTRPIVRPTHGEGGAAQQQQQSSLNNGYNNNQYQRKPTLYDRASATKIAEFPDSVDHRFQHGSNSSGIYRDSNDSLSHPAEVDTPHNDREPLLPRYDRRLISHQIPTQSKSRNSLYDNHNDFDNHSHMIKPNGAGHHQLGSGRHHFDEPYFNESTSHPASASSLSSSNHHTGRGLVSSKYNNSPYRKYESRDMDNNNSKLTNSRSYWSCGSCTYDNQVSSEICEICRSRRQSR